MSNDGDVSVRRPDRLVSVDALRGFNFVWILGGDGAIWALSDMLDDRAPALSGIAEFLNAQMHHVAWEGFTFYDFIFPLFVFITGVSIVLSLPRLVERRGMTAAQLHVLRRALVLYGLGLLYYGGMKDGWDNIRFLGVLQRISICYLVTSLIFLHLNRRAMIAIFVALMVGYWALLTFVPVPGIGAGHFAPDQNLANWVDVHYLPGRLWDKTRDPEGLLSTLPAIGTCLLGVLAGGILVDDRLKPYGRTMWLIAIGVVAVAAGHLWALQFPIIKSIWTSSFVLVAGGYSFILMGFAHQVIDVWGLRIWAAPFVWIGTNAIALYLFNGFVGFMPLAQRLVGGDTVQYLDRAVAPGAQYFVANLLGLAMAIAVARYLFKRQMFLRVT